jgi:hypothetical protein
MSQFNEQNLPTYGGGIVVQGTPLMDGTNLVNEAEVTSPLFSLEYGAGVDTLAVPNVGQVYDPVVGMSVARPLVVLTDLLQYLDNNPGMGLVDENPRDPQEAPWVKSLREHAIPAIKRQELLTILPGDVHIDPAAWNLKSLTSYKIVMDHLHPTQQQRVRNNPQLMRKAYSGERITVEEYFQVLMEGQPVADKEDANFIPHCRQHFVKYIPSAQNLLNYAAGKALQEQQSQGSARPKPFVFRDHKTGLGMKSPADSYGLGGNNFYSLMRFAYNGLYTDGRYHRGQKVMIAGGTASEYSLPALLREAVDLDFYVIWMLPWSGSMGIESLLSLVYDMRLKYGKKVLPTWDWPDQLFFGPEPSGFRQLSNTMRAQLHVDEFGRKGSALYSSYQKLLAEQTQMIRNNERPPYALDRICNMFQEKTDRDEPLYWSMVEIMKYLRNGGEK